MDNVQFEEEDVNNQLFKRSTVYKGLIGLVIKTGLAKNDAQANIALIIVSILCIVGIVFVIISNKPSINNEAQQSVKTPEQIKAMMNLK